MPGEEAIIPRRGRMRASLEPVNTDAATIGRAGIHRFRARLAGIPE